MYRSQVYNETRFGRLTPIGRIDVVPGQSIDLDSIVRMRSPNFIDPLLSGGMWTVASFYVPYRLLWGGWIDFVTQRTGVSGSDRAARVPESAASWGFMLERRSVASNVWARRAYKLIYNQFFGDKDMGFYYDDITNDASQTLFVVRTLEQFLAKLVMSGSITDLTYQIPVVSANAVVNLNELRHQLEVARSFKRRDMTGNKYVDALLSMGVKLDWRVQQAPELLALHKGEWHPSLTAAQNRVETGDQTLGQSSTYIDLEARHRTGRKFFAEHGIVLTCAVLRQHMFYNTSAGSDFQSRITQDEYFWGDNMDGKTRQIAGNLVGSVSVSTAQLPRFQDYESGQNILGDYGSRPWVASVDSDKPSIEQVVYPYAAFAQVPHTLKAGSDMVCYARHTADIKTPIGKGVHRI